MAVVDVSQLLAEVSPESPCGEDLEYDPAFGEMERASQGRPEQQMGDSVKPAEDPEWKIVREKATDVLSRSKDLRAAVFLSRALLNTEGFPGLADGLELVKGLLDRYWEQFHPRLDPEDNNDPMMRVNTIASLADNEFVQEVRHSPLVSSRVLGRFGLRDVDIALGHISAPAGTAAPPDMATIDGAFMEAELEDLQVTAEAVERAGVLAREVESKLAEYVGVGSGADLAPLMQVLKAGGEVLSQQLARRGVGEAPGTEGAAAGQPRSGEITSRDDVVRMLDRACEYFERHEPSSPVPLLLKRAKRLVSMDFMDIMRDMAPGGVQQAETISGNKGDGS